MRSRPPPFHLLSSLLIEGPLPDSFGKDGCFSQFIAFAENFTGGCQEERLNERLCREFNDASQINEVWRLRL